MNITATLKEIESWPVDDRIELVQRVWDGIIDAGWEPELTEDLKCELDRRLKSLEENPDDVVSWEEAIENMRRSDETPPEIDVCGL